MKSLELNKTPIRTSKNFNINSIKLDNVNIPNKIGNFNNIEIQGETSKINIEQANGCSLVYGLGEDFSNQVKEQANQKIKLVIDNKTNKEIQINFKFDKENQSLVDNIEIIANENTSSTVILKYESEKNIEAYHNGIIKLFAKHN